MERTKKKPPQKKKLRRSKTNAVSGFSPLAPGMPSPDNVVKVTDVVSPQGFEYKDIETNETDAYDPPLKSKRRPK